MKVMITNEKKLLIVKQILLASTLGNIENSVENMHTDVRVGRVNGCLKR